MVWVHGFHLLLLPSFLTRVLRTARVGLFLHTPFPSSEIFRTLPCREDLLRGMLNADQVPGIIQYTMVMVSVFRLFHFPDPHTPCVSTVLLECSHS